LVSLSRRGEDVSFKLADHLFEWTPKQKLEGLTMASGECLGGGFLGKALRQPIVIILSRVVIPHGGQIDQTPEATWKGYQRAVLQVSTRLFHLNCHCLLQHFSP